MEIKTKENVITRLRDQEGVNIFTLSKFLQLYFRRSDLPSQIDVLFVSSTVTVNQNVVDKRRKATSRYAIIGDKDFIHYLSFLMNSNVGKKKLLQLSTGSKLNLRTLVAYPLPNEDLSDSMGVMALTAVMDLLDKWLGSDVAHDNLMDSYRVFFSLVHDNYVMQLYLPEEFAERRVDIVGPWNSLMNEAHIKFGRFPLDLDELEAFFDFTLEQGKRFLAELNKLKVFGLELFKTL